LAHKELRRSRVLVAAAGLFLGLGVLWLRLGWIQVVQHRHFAGRAEHLQEQRVLLKPVRGAILDRKGRPLARDLIAYSVSAAPREMRDPPAVARRLAKALDLDPRRLRREFVKRPRFLWVARHVSPQPAQSVSAMRERGVYVAVETRRVQPAGAAELLGQTDLDNLGVEGLELQFDEVLRGRPGWTTLFRDGRGMQHQLPRGLKREPENGRHLVLTLDADLQALAETHLEAAVESLKATRGFAVFLDPASGEILAMACVPHTGPGPARNRVVSDQYEPGSTFKLVVMVAALEEGIASPDERFDAENGAFRFARGAVIRDVHAYGEITLADAFRVSSNIVMGKLALRVGDRRLYRYATSLGFGSLTGIDFPGEAAGLLRPPERWSGRSTPTVAIGYEVTCTPLQMALAYAAIANGGVLMRPQLVLEERSATGQTVRRYAPQAVQRVCSEATAAELRRLMVSVVDSGTARTARVGGLSVAGKTGTARKYAPEVGTYAQGKYLSSFVGFAPADQPRVLGLIVIDEPRSRAYYGGEVAAPVFRRVLDDALGLPQGPLRPNYTMVALQPPAPAPVMVPDLRLLPLRQAYDELSGLGLRALVRGPGPRVVSQHPPAGTAVERGARVTLDLRAGVDSSERVLPDVRGLAAREALRRLSQRLVAVRVRGSGVVVDQSPPPGTPLPLRGTCELRCEPLALAGAVRREPPARWMAAAR
jgi:cell division protein FtsI/penicillin-binding protein 2